MKTILLHSFIFNLSIQILFLIIVIGLVRVLTKPFTGFVDFVMNLFLIDLLIDLIFEITKTLDNE